MTPREYNEIIREYFNISDDKTRHYIIALEDEGKDQLLTSLSSALYDKIVDKVDKIDFGSIPQSKGDITRVDRFDNTMECLDIIRKLVVEYRENPDIVDTVIKAVENVKVRKPLFSKAFSLNVELPIMVYNLIVLSIEQSVSFLIAVCIQYIKDPSATTIKAALDTTSYVNAKDNLIYDQLAIFNSSCMNKDLDHTLETVIKNNGKVSESAPEVNDFDFGRSEDRFDYIDSPFKKFDECPPEDSDSRVVGGRCKKERPPHARYAGMSDMYGGERISINGDYEYRGNGSVQEFAPAAAGVLVGGAALVSFGLKGLRYLIKVIIPCLRNITYFFINSRVKLADSLEIQAQFIEVNAYKLKYSTNSNLSDKEREKVVDRQLKWAERLKKWSNRIAIDNKKAQNDAMEMAREEEKKMTIDDLQDQLPQDDTDNGGSLF